MCDKLARTEGKISLHSGRAQIGVGIVQQRLLGKLESSQTFALI